MERARRRLGALSLLGLAACFDGDGTLGGFCERDGDCGDGQTCRNEVCGHCDDGVAQAGEVCLVDGPITALGAGSVAFVPFDSDGDGRLELLAHSPGQGATAETLALWVADDDGQFSRSTEIPLQADAVSVATGDLDGDAIADLVIGTREGVTVAYGPELQPGPRLVLGVSVRAVVVGRFAQERAVVAALGEDPTGQGDRISMLAWAGDRSGTLLGPPTSLSSGSIVAGPIRADEDAEDDFIVIEGTSVSVLQSQASPPNYAFTPSFETDVTIVGATTFGFDEDQRGRGALLGEDGTVVVVAPGQEALLTPVQTLSSAVAEPQDVTGVDLDGNRSSDLVVAGEGTIRGVLLRASVEAFSIELAVDVSDPSIAAGLIDADAFVDLLVHDRQADQLRVLRGDP